MKYKRKIEKENNIRKYGEFVCSYHQWLDLDLQKKNAERLAKITKEKK